MTRRSEIWDEKDKNPNPRQNKILSWFLISASMFGAMYLTSYFIDFWNATSKITP